MKAIPTLAATAAALLILSGCSAYPIPANPAPIQMKSEGMMIKYCRGAIAGKANTKPINVRMGAIEKDQGATFISGTIDGIRYNCQFDAKGNFVSVGQFAN